MSVYLVGIRQNTKDLEAFETYKALAPDTLPEGTIKLASALGKFEVLEGEAPAAVTIARFETREIALEWFNSPEYQAASEYRRKVGDFQMLLVEGLD